MFRGDVSLCKDRFIPANLPSFILESHVLRKHTGKSSKYSTGEQSDQSIVELHIVISLIKVERDEIVCRVSLRVGYGANCCEVIDDKCTKGNQMIPDRQEYLLAVNLNPAEEHAVEEVSEEWLENKPVEKDHPVESKCARLPDLNDESHPFTCFKQSNECEPEG